ncbi:hypothetical protein BC940DRAFT_315777 [Gongronella butleri]|nr:hypothetical protein BC940DRAFT_315777 [Gongronella butleri]
MPKTRQRARPDPRFTRRTRSMSAAESVTGLPESIQQMDIVSPSSTVPSAQNTPPSEPVVDSLLIPASDARVAMEPDTYKEVWLCVFKHLPLRDLVQVSRVCHGFHSFVPHMHVWKEVLVKARKPLPKRQSPMMSVMHLQRKRGVCEDCHFIGPPSGSGSVVKMSFANGERARDLCLRCRKRLVRADVNIEPVQDLHLGTQITKTRVITELHFNPDAYGLPARLVRNPIHRRFHPMHLYDTAQVIQTAIRHHGGYCGLRAAQARSAKLKQTRFDNLAAAAQAAEEVEEGNDTIHDADDVLPDAHTDDADVATHDTHTADEDENESENEMSSESSDDEDESASESETSNESSDDDN